MALCSPAVGVVFDDPKGLADDYYTDGRYAT
jgi:hypothetical protein